MELSLDNSASEEYKAMEDGVIENWYLSIVFWFLVNCEFLELLSIDFWQLACQAHWCFYFLIIKKNAILLIFNFWHYFKEKIIFHLHFFVKKSSSKNKIAHLFFLTKTEVLSLISLSLPKRFRDSSEHTIDTSMINVNMSWLLLQKYSK